MDSLKETLARLYRNLEKWSTAVKNVLTADQHDQVKGLMLYVDTVIRLASNDLQQLHDAYDALFSSINNIAIAVIDDDRVVKNAIAGRSSSDELGLRQLSITIVSELKRLRETDLIMLLKKDVNGLDRSKVTRYLESVDTIGVFEAILLATLPEPPHELTQKIETAKNAALSAATGGFDLEWLLIRAARETAYSTESDLASLLKPGATSFQDIAPCIIAKRTVGSQHYFNIDCLLQAKLDPSAGLSNQFLQAHRTIIKSESSTREAPSFTIIGDNASSSFTLIDTIDGITFAQLSIDGTKTIDRSKLLIFFGERPDREGAYHRALEPQIMANCHDPRAKMVMQNYANAKFDLDPGTLLLAIDAEFRKEYAGIASKIVDRNTYVRLLSSREMIMSVLTRANTDEMNLRAAFAFDRSANQFVKIYEKYLTKTAPSDREIDNVANPKKLLQSSFENSLELTIKEAKTNKTFQRPARTLVDFASRGMASPCSTIPRGSALGPEDRRASQ